MKVKLHTVKVVLTVCEKLITHVCKQCLQCVKISLHTEVNLAAHGYRFRLPFPKFKTWENLSDINKPNCYFLLARTRVNTKSPFYIRRSLQNLFQRDKSPWSNQLRIL